MPPLVLGSTSPRRRVLLSQIVDDFEIHPVQVEEVAPRALHVFEAVKVIARKKAIASSRQKPGQYVLGADTVVVHQADLIGKARNPDAARLTLARLAGETHEVQTGVALAYNGQMVDATQAITHVTMERFPRDVLDAYIAGGYWEGKAGGYGIQDRLLAPYITIDGTWSNVVGLPLPETVQLLRKAGITCRDAPDETALADADLF